MPTWIFGHTMKLVRLNTSFEWTPPYFERFVDVHSTLPYKAPPLNRQPQPWTLNVLLTLFSNFPCVLRPKIEWHPVPTILYLSALHHGTWRDGTIYIHFIFALHVYTCMCARVSFDLTMTRKRKYIVKILGQKADALQYLLNGMAMRAMENSKIVTFHEFLQKKSNKRWLLECPS